MTIECGQFDIPIEKFPVRIEALHPDTRAVVWTREVARPGVIEIPGRAATGHKVDIRIIYGDGTVEEMDNE